MEKPESLLPLGQTTYYILASLFHRPKHGYAILKDIEALSEGDVRLAIGNVYVMLKRLMEQGLVERTPQALGVDERRKTYRLTGLGERVLELEQARLRRMMQAASLRTAKQGA